MTIPFLNPKVPKSDIVRMVKAIRSGWLTNGPELKELEEKLAMYLGIEHVVADSSGTAALHTALMAAGVGPGDEVITTPLTYWATSNVVLYVGATPVFVDVESKTGLIDPKKVEAAITKRTKAIIPVHLYGQMADMRALSKIAKKYKVRIIEDACHAFEASRDGVRPGELSFPTCHSFHAAKNITAGEGGAVGVHTEKNKKLVTMFTDSGTARSGKIRHMPVLGYKYSFTNAQAALLLGQLARIESEWKKRRRKYIRYQKAFQGVPGVTLIEEVPNARHACHMFTIIVDPKKRDGIRAKIRETGILADVHYNPVHLEPYYTKRFKYKKGAYPITERIGFGTITLPLYNSLTEREQDFVIDTVCRVVGKTCS